jgi:hypothetical protein
VLDDDDPPEDEEEGADDGRTGPGLQAVEHGQRFASLSSHEPETRDQNSGWGLNPSDS